MPHKRTNKKSDNQSQAMEKTDAAHQNLNPEVPGGFPHPYLSRRIIETTTDGVWFWDNNHAICEVNDAACKMSGYTRDELLTMHVKDIEAVDSAQEIKARIADISRKGFVRFETKHRCKDGTIIIVEVSASIIDEAENRGIAFVRDITKRKQAEKEHQSHIHFLESLEQVDRLIKQETDIEQMLWAVVQAVLDLFQCDRAWLLHPCDPDAPFFRVPVEINKPEYPGAKALNLEVPMSSGFAQDMRDALGSEVPLMYGPGTGRALSSGVNGGHFGVQTQMFMALYPKVGRQWLFGIHQCSHPKVWSQQEQNLFKAIGRRISDGLSSVLYLRELKQSEERFRSMFEQAAVGVALCDPQTGRFMKVNQKYADIVGFTMEELDQIPFDEIAHPEDLKRDQDNFQLLLQGDIKEYKLDKRYLRKDGSVIWGRVTVSLMWPTGEKPSYAIAILEDITDQKMAEEALKNSETKYKDIFNNMLDMYVETGLDGNIIEVSPSFENYLGYKRAEIIGTPSRDHYAEQQKREALLKAVTEKGIVHDFEMEAIHKEGYRVPLSITGTLLKDDHGNPRKMIGMLRDISERKKAENQLRRQKNLFETMFNSIPDAVVLTDSHNEIQLVNNSVASIFGYRPEEVLGQSGKIFHAGQWEYDQTAMAVADRKAILPQYAYVGRYKRKDGSEFNGETIEAKLLDEKNQWVGNLSITRDITDREQAELQLRQAQKMESIGNLAGGIAHDFNNILSSIIGFTELALEDVAPGSEQEDNLQEVFVAGKRAKDLVKQILAFARQSEEKAQPIRVDKIVNEVAKFLRSSIPTSIEIKQRIASQSFVMGNPIQIHQIVMNLCTNAYHAMEETGGLLSIDLQDLAVEKGSKMYREGLKPVEYIELAISDTGIGIAPEAIGSIFDPYYTTKGPGAGTGLGLSVVHGIVENSGGKITVQSAPQKGTLFKVYLPIAKGSDEERAEVPENLPSGTERVLFVDDEAPIVKMGHQILSRLGYSVTTQTSSVEALALFRSNPENFDLIITDMTMPNISGDQLAARLMKIRPDIPVILCTGYSKKISPQTAADMGIKGFSFKPIVKADLANTVRKVLDKVKGEPQ